MLLVEEITEDVRFIMLPSVSLKKDCINPSSNIKNSHKKSANYETTVQK